MSDEWNLYAQNWLKEHNLRKKNYIVIGLGARKAKRQPTAEQILRWAHHLYKEFDLNTVFVWTPGKKDDPLYPGDDDIANEVLSHTTNYIYPYRGPILPTIGLIWYAKLSIFPDSGLMHFAAISPGGVIGLFADIKNSPPPQRWKPIGSKTSYIVSEKRISTLPDEKIFKNLGQFIK